MKQSAEDVIFRSYQTVKQNRADVSIIPEGEFGNDTDIIVTRDADGYIKIIRG